MRGFSKVWNFIVSTGVSPGNTRGKNISIATFDAVLLMASLTAALFLFLEFSSGNLFLFYINSTLIFAYALSFFLNRRGYSVGSVAVAVIATIINTMLSADSLGKESNVHLFLLAAIAAPFAGIEYKQHRSILVLSSLGLLSFVVMYVLPDHSFTPSSQIYAPFQNLIPVVLAPLIIGAMFYKSLRIYAELLKEAEQVKVERFRQSRMAAVGEMASGIAHEVNNPLQIIAAHAFSIQQKLAKPEPDLNAVAALALKVEDTSYRIGKIVTGLLKFSRGEANLNRERESVSSIVSSSLDLCRERLKSRQVAIRGVFVEDCELFVRGTQISQVLINLIGNSMDALAEKSDGWIEVHGKDLKSSYKLEVHDSAGPIPKEIADKMMQPFFSTKPVGQGTGLGLSISKGIIEEHGGKLFYQSSEGLSKFIIQIPKD